MPIFSDETSSSPLSVETAQFIVRVSHIIPNDGDCTLPPSWGAFADEPRLKFLGAFCGSSIGGMSYAKLRLAAGAPYTTGDIENEDPLAQGDRVIVCLRELGGDRPIWAGYMVQSQIVIAENGESIVYRCAGPEWLWGASQTEGCDTPVYGQVRRRADSDDDFIDSLADPLESTRADLMLVTDLPTVFNPDGRQNRTANIVDIGAVAQVSGYVFEEPDRVCQSTALTAHWTMREAAKLLFEWYNDPDFSGIAGPDDWATDPLSDDQMPPTNVDGLGLWEALKRVCGPEFQFYIDPRPTGSTLWSGFKIVFFRRGVDIDGTSADLWLNPRDTAAKDAKASIVRLEAAKDSSKVVNEVTVLGKALRHIKLIYHGAETVTIDPDTTEGKLVLQHGWTQGEGDLFTFEGLDGEDRIVDRASIEALSAATAQQWLDRYTVGGKEFAKYSHVFRLFIWNESGEFRSGAETSTQPVYVTTGLPWFVPDLTIVADNTALAAEEDVITGGYCRRRRRLLDTVYPDPALPGEQWPRVPVQVYIGAADDEGAVNNWVRLGSGDYRVDREIGAIWITRPNLAEWYPLDRLEDEPDLHDGRTYTTLLHTGVLRLLVEASIETDLALAAKSPRSSHSGSALVRSAVIRNANYVRSAVFDDGVTSPSGLTENAMDMSADALALAEQHRLAAQDLATHASILTAADWPMQGIGKIILETQGRVIDLRGGPPGTLLGRGAQVVALHLDPAAMKVELLTESAALQLRRLDTPRLGSRKPAMFRRAVSGAEEAAPAGEDQ